MKYNPWISAFLLINVAFNCSVLLYGIKGLQLLKKIVTYQFIYILHTIIHTCTRAMFPPIIFHCSDFLSMFPKFAWKQKIYMYICKFGFFPNNDYRKLKNQIRLSLYTCLHCQENNIMLFGNNKCKIKILICIMFTTDVYNFLNFLQIFTNCFDLPVLKAWKLMSSPNFLLIQAKKEPK